MLLRVFSLAFLLTVSVLFYGMSTAPAHAYLDPGTGSMILQVLLGGVAGIALAGRFYWHKFREFLGLKSATAATDEADGRLSARSRSQADN